MDRELLTTQIMIAGHPGNLRDGVFMSAGDLIDRELIQTEFKPVPGSKVGELAARFDIILGRTPDEETLQRGKTGGVQRPDVGDRRRLSEIPP